MSVEADLKGLLTAGVLKVLERPEFATWIANEDDFEEGHIGINNSLIFREELATVKNDKFLCVPLEKGGTPSGERVCLKATGNALRTISSYNDL